MLNCKVKSYHVCFEISFLQQSRIIINLPNGSWQWRHQMDPLSLTFPSFFGRRKRVSQHSLLPWSCHRGFWNPTLRFLRIMQAKLAHSIYACVYRNELCFRRAYLGCCKQGKFFQKGIICWKLKIAIIVDYHILAILRGLIFNILVKVHKSKGRTLFIANV